MAQFGGGPRGFVAQWGKRHEGVWHHEAGDTGVYGTMRVRAIRVYAMRGRAMSVYEIMSGKATWVYGIKRWRATRVYGTMRGRATRVYSTMGGGPWGSMPRWGGSQGCMAL